MLILHADEIGMCYDANAAAKSYLESGAIRSAAIIIPCPWFSKERVLFTDWKEMMKRWRKRDERASRIE